MFAFGVYFLQHNLLVKSKHQSYDITQNSN